MVLKSNKKDRDKRKEREPMRKKSKSSKKEDKILFAFLGTFFTVIGFVIALILKKQDKYIMFYAKQGLVLFIGQVIIVVVSPFLFFIVPFVWIFWIVLWIIAWVNSLSGEMKNTFLIGDLAEKIKIVRA